MILTSGSLQIEALLPDMVELSSDRDRDKLSWQLVLFMISSTRNGFTRIGARAAPTVHMRCMAWKRGALARCPDHNGSKNALPPEKQEATSAKDEGIM
jgi:hypothetical protein